MTLSQYFNIFCASFVMTVIFLLCLWLVMSKSAGNSNYTDFTQTKLLLCGFSFVSVCICFLTTTPNCSHSAKSSYSSFISPRTLSCSGAGSCLIRFYGEIRGLYTWVIGSGDNYVCATYMCPKLPLEPDMGLHKTQRQIDWSELCTWTMDSVRSFSLTSRMAFLISSYGRRKDPRKMAV